MNLPKVHLKGEKMTIKGSEMIVVLTCKACKCLYSKKPGFSFLERLNPKMSSEIVALLKEDMIVVKRLGRCRECTRIKAKQRQPYWEAHPRQKSTGLFPE